MTALQERNYLDAERECEEAELMEGECASGNDCVKEMGALLPLKRRKAGK